MLQLIVVVLHSLTAGGEIVDSDSIASGETKKNYSLAA